jgi:hypothetical protein
MDTSEMPYGSESAMPRTNRPEDQLDRETQDEIRQWEQTTAENRGELAKALHQQIMAQMSSVRTIAAEEKAVKATATIDGLLLARQGRLDEFLKKVDEEKRVLQQQTQDPRNPGGTAESLRRGTGRTSPGGTMPQDNQSRTRGRRR